MENESLKATRKHFSKLGLLLFLSAIICAAVQGISLLIATVATPNLVQNSDYSLIISMLPIYAIAMPIMALFIKRLPAVSIQKHSLSLGQWFQAFCICYGLMYVSNMIGIFSTEFIGTLKGGTVENIVAELVETLSPWSAIPFMVILAPIFEEFIFRKMIIDRTVRYGEGTAIVVSALSFALFHGNLNQFAYALVLGLFWGFLYVKTGTIKYTMYMHVIINFMGAVPGMLLARSSFYNELLKFENSTDFQKLLTLVSEHAIEIVCSMIYSILVFILVVAGLLLFFFNLKKITLSSGDIVIPKGKRFSTILLNWGMLLNIGYWGFQIVLQLLS